MDKHNKHNSQMTSEGVFSKMFHPLIAWLWEPHGSSLWRITVVPHKLQVGPFWTQASDLFIIDTKDCCLFDRPYFSSLSCLVRGNYSVLPPIVLLWKALDKSVLDSCLLAIHLFLYFWLQHCLPCSALTHLFSPTWMKIFPWTPPALPVFGLSW